MTTEQLYEQRARDWLELGPTRLPAGALESAMTAIATVPQERRRPRVAGRPLSRRALLLAAAVGVLTLATGAALIGSYLSDAPREPADLLYDFPEASRILERSGGPAASATTVDVGDLPDGRALVVASACTGAGSAAVVVRDPTAELGEPVPGEPVPELTPLHRSDLTCDGRSGHFLISTGDNFLMTRRLSIELPAGATWQIAVGEFRDVPTDPSFPGITPTDGAYLVQAAGLQPILLADSGAGIGVQVPDGADHVRVLMYCSGDPVTLRTEPGGFTEVVDCADPSQRIGVVVPTTGLAVDVIAESDGISWVVFGAEADGPGTTVLPTAPPLPAGVGSVAFAASDGNYVAMGTLGGNEQTLAQLTGAETGPVGGGHFGVTSSDGNGGERLEIWSIDAGGPVAEVRSVGLGQGLYPGPTDGTHGWHYYTLMGLGFSFEYHRVALDGTNDTVVANVAPGWSVPPSHVLAADDSAFIVDACTVTGCTRTVVDAATGEAGTFELTGGDTCDLLGAIDGFVVRTTGECDLGSGQVLVMSGTAEGAEERILVDAMVRGIVIEASDGPRLVTYRNVEVGGTESRMETTVASVPLAGGDLEEVLVFTEEGSTRTLQSMELPAGDWVLVGTSLGDIPTSQSVRETPFLLDIATGETIELVNLPHTD